MNQPAREVELAAQAFLTALDEGRWRDAAGLVDAHTREALQAWCVERIRTAGGSAGDTGTQFLSPTVLMGVSTAEEASLLTSTELVARFAEGVSRAGVDRHAAEPGLSRITRRFLDASVSQGRATVHYRTEWWNGEERNVAMGGVHSLELVMTPEGWRVRDADLGAWGTGHLLPPPA